MSTLEAFALVAILISIPGAIAIAGALAYWVGLVDAPEPADPETDTETMADRLADDAEQEQDGERS